MRTLAANTLSSCSRPAGCCRIGRGYAVCLLCVFVVICHNYGMAKGYREVPRDQLYLLPPDRRDWLAADHPVWLVITVVTDHLDTSAFHAFRRTGGAGAAGYDPDMLVTLLVWAYANRVTSSRRIEQLCQTDAAFMVICAGNHPDHVTIARFRAQAGTAMAGLFAEVLGLCARLGMGKLGVVALDGTKVAASASKSANRSLARLRDLAAETVAEHAAADAAEDAAYGAGRRGDEVPGQVASPQSRAGRKARAGRIARALAEMEAEAEAGEKAEREEQAAKTGTFRERKAAGQPTGRAPAGSEAGLAQEKVDAEIARQQARIDDWHARQAARAAAGQKKMTGPPPAPAAGYCRVREAEAERDAARDRDAARQAARDAQRATRSRNITDPDSRLMPVRGGGFIQGYNTQNVTSEDGLIIATEVTGTPGDVTWFEPMAAKAEAAAEYIAARQPPATTAPDTTSSDTTSTAAPGTSCTCGTTAPGTGSTAAAPGTGSTGTAAPATSSSDSTGCTCGTCGRCLIRLFLTDAGYKSEHNMTCPGPDRLIAVGKHRDLEHAARDPGAPAGPGEPDGPATAAMAERLKTPEGITAYRQRGHIAETPHGNIKHNLGFRQFSLRGTPKVTAEWNLITSVHNLLTAISAGQLTTQALTAL